MPLFGREEWKAAMKVQKTKRNLQTRQRKLLILWRRSREKFRRDDKIQLELRRVALLCTKLSVPLHSALESEIVDHVMTT